ncbi:heavy-metal-associated domain-containing protein [Roseomonas genomospecies 6]|uniref:Heavy-metal-associated domain-containing protein n=2 Tax=Roseomonas genomospecies 6 TaxID=214106 RepID=A0A9W7NIK3_9PROT|nr:heavy-metal-associated domain-containing protein [Roseomonas genomospecies 6]
MRATPWGGFHKTVDLPMTGRWTLSSRDEPDQSGRTPSRRIPMLQFTVPGMTCGGCANAIRKALVAVPGIKGIQADPPNRRLAVKGDVGADLIIRTLADAGYDAAPAA